MAHERHLLQRTREKLLSANGGARLLALRLLRRVRWGGCDPRAEETFLRGRTRRAAELGTSFIARFHVPLFPLPFLFLSRGVSLYLINV